MIKPGLALKTALPVMFGYFPVAIAFGLLANQQGASLAITMALSSCVYAGASQFVALTLLASGATEFVSVFITIGLINLRHFILSLAYLPETRSWSLAQKLRFFPLLTDETFAVLLGTAPLKRDARAATAVALFNYLTWVAGSAIGFFSGALVPDPKRFGLDFALAALFIGIIVLFLKKRSHVVTFVSCVVLSFFFFRVLDWGRNGVLLAALIGSAIGWFVGRGELPATAEVGV
ncbi:AzlC family ABC transporter permease [soil metagenome]